MKPLPALAVAALALVLALAPRAGAGTPPADVSGDYGGSVKYKYFPLVEGTPSKGKFDATAAATFNAPNLSVTLTVMAEEGPEVYTLAGRSGLGHFWASGNGPGGQMAMTGVAKGAEGSVKLVGKGSLVNTDTVNEIVVSLKQTPPL